MANKSDVGDPEFVEAVKEGFKTEAALEEMALRGLLKTYDGRLLLWNILDQCGVYSISFVAGQADATAFREGQRNIGLTVLQKIVTSDPNAYVVMQTEAQSRKAKRGKK